MARRAFFGDHAWTGWQIFGMVFIVLLVLGILYAVVGMNNYKAASSNITMIIIIGAIVWHYRTRELTSSGGDWNF